MKLFTLLLFVVIPIIAQAQEGPYSHLVIQDGQVLFEEIYKLDSVASEDVKLRLSQYVPGIKNLVDYHLEGDVITARFSGAMIDYRKYGGKWGNTAVYLNHPFSANINIVWKEGKYKAAVTNIVFHTAGFGDVYATELLSKGKSERKWLTGKMAVQAGTYINDYLYDQFVLKENKKW
ncbi:hypothetical protein [Chitinophaga pinensis]|uniref:DUF4468 domain-containing protein n=1 Tax=Chitinophaga pinensis (strain ATCC 43595 / DSM 2588 / LMG 13176 / NBRC 15968 / NCIMB 11800 / UQM 2034) TaxID=485918 RepID=A0A979G5S8_CHIPD|nr:hypothetical protein [Chitinophaga pinensis]ACU61336.1 hypothetical protein Cpin_3874 [Chitinophaga pinensis DSM 2588]